MILIVFFTLTIPALLLFRRARLVAVILLSLSMSACQRDSNAINKEILKLPAPQMNKQQFFSNPAYKFELDQKLKDYDDKSKSLKLDLASAYNTEGAPDKAIDILQELIEHPLYSDDEELINNFRKLQGSSLTPAMKALNDAINTVRLSRLQLYYTELARSFQLSGDKEREGAARKKLTELAHQDQVNRGQAAQHERELATNEQRDKEQRLKKILSSDK